MSTKVNIDWKKPEPQVCCFSELSLTSFFRHEGLLKLKIFHHNTLNSGTKTAIANTICFNTNGDRYYQLQL